MIHWRAFPQFARSGHAFRIDSWFRPFHSPATVATRSGRIGAPHSVIQSRRRVGTGGGLVRYVDLFVRWRKTASFGKFGKVANVGLMIAGVLLLLMQLHGYQHSQFLEDFPLNREEHFEIHENIERNRDLPPSAGETNAQPSLPQNSQQ